jgi:hypothetical protein
MCNPFLCMALAPLKKNMSEEEIAYWDQRYDDEAEFTKDDVKIMFSALGTALLVVVGCVAWQLLK